jgi:hypothetical protein
MTEDKFQQLVCDHPDLFQKAGDIEFSIGDGWFTIINTLCGLISHDLENAKSRLKYALENPNAKMGESVADLEKKVAEEYDNLPTLTQIKEKFGSLRFYYDGGKEDINSYVHFAESMTCHTCEVCGSPGQRRNDGWIKVLCDKHHKETEVPDVVSFGKSNAGPKLSDEN